MIEDIQIWESPQPIEFRLRAPKQWTPTLKMEELAETPGALDSWRLRLENIYEGVRAAEISVCVFRRSNTTTPVKLITNHLQQLRARGMRIGGAPLLSLPTKEGFTAVWLCVPPAEFQGQSFDTPTQVFEHPSALFLISLLGPAQSTSPEWWAINKQAFDLVRGTLELSGPTTFPKGDVR